MSPWPASRGFPSGASATVERPGPGWVLGLTVSLGVHGGYADEHSGQRLLEFTARERHLSEFQGQLLDVGKPFGSRC